MSKRKRSKAVSLPIVEANAAGIDIGATQIFVAVPADRDVESIRCFDTFTADLERLADWLEQCQIRTVAMESTGVYWIPLPKEKNPRKTPWRNEPPQLREDLYRTFGVDLTQIPGINTLTAQMLLTEIGPDLSCFPTAPAFCSWLRLCPEPKISGGKVLSSKTRPTKNRAALALRMAAQGLHRSQTFLGDYFRRMKARLGTPKAITAAAHKLARIVYHMITTHQEYDTTVFQELERRVQDRKRMKLRAQARALGFELVPREAVP